MAQLFTLLCTAIAAWNCVLVDGTTYQLPYYSRPIHYNVRLELSSKLEDRSYVGEVNITLEMYYLTNEIVLHSDPGLNVTAVELRSVEPNETLVEVDFIQVPEPQFLVINAQQLLELKNYQLKIQFSSVLEQNNRQGFFVDSYYVEDNQEVFYAMTDLEPTYARKVFPCYDEPYFRATFDVEIVCNKQFSAHSNGALKEVEKLDDDRKLVRFERTPPMPTYLVAVLVSQLQESSRDFDGIRIGMVTRPVEQQMLEFAFGITEKTLQLLQDYTALRYSLPKLYQVGISGHPRAAENWGLILYNEKQLIVDPDGQDSDKLLSALLITHEIAHQFFGNLVGIYLWNHSWLKEGFATFLADKITRQLLPNLSWWIEHQYRINTWEALSYDASPLSHPMSYYVEDPEDALLGDVIVYEKSSRVIRMMEHALGSKTFQQGIQYYLSTYQYDTAGPRNLYSSLMSVSENSSSIPQDTNIMEIFDSWVSQHGHPIVFVERIGNTDRYRFTQKSYRSCSCSEASWWIPIFYSSPELDPKLGDSPAFWIPNHRDSIVARLDGAFPLVNTQSLGFYRVLYWTGGWKEISNNWSSINASGRAKILDDAFSLVWDQELTMNSLLPLLFKLKEDTDPLPWLTAMADHNMWRFVRAFSLTRTQRDENIEELAKWLTSGMLRTFVNDPRPESRAVLALGIQWACRLELPVCGQILRSTKDNTKCLSLTSSDYINELGCSAQSYEELWNSITIGKCLKNGTIYGEVSRNLIQNYRCPQILELLDLLIESGLHYFDQLLEQVIDDLEFIRNMTKPARMEQFVVKAAYHVMRTTEQQSILTLMDSLEDEMAVKRRISVEEFMTDQLSKIDLMTEKVGGVLKNIGTMILMETMVDDGANRKDYRGR